MAHSWEMVDSRFKAHLSYSVGQAFNPEEDYSGQNRQE